MRGHVVSIAVAAMLLAGYVVEANGQRQRSTQEPAWPLIIMVYGESLSQPIFVELGLDPNSHGSYNFLFGDSPDSSSPEGLGNRPYFKLAMFWDASRFEKYLKDRRLLPTLRPEEANQQGRLYPPTSTEAAIAVVSPYVLRRDGTSTGLEFPTLDSLTTFSHQVKLTSQNLKVARALGLPGF